MLKPKTKRRKAESLIYLIKACHQITFFPKKWIKGDVMTNVQPMKDPKSREVLAIIIKGLSYQYPKDISTLQKKITYRYPFSGSKKPSILVHSFTGTTNGTEYLLNKAERSTKDLSDQVFELLVVAT